MRLGSVHDVRDVLLEQIPPVDEGARRLANLIEVLLTALISLLD